MQASKESPSQCSLSFVVETFYLSDPWKDELVPSIRKSDDPFNTNNHRSISISPVQNRYLRTTEIVSRKRKHQYAFPLCCPTGDLLACISLSRSTALEYYGPKFLVLLEFTKAFDSIWHKNYWTSSPSLVLLRFQVATVSEPVPSVFMVFHPNCSP